MRATNHPDMLTIPTRLTPELIERHTASGHWRGDTIYALAKGHAERAPDSFAVRDRYPPHHLSPACRRRRCAGGRSGAARRRAGPARRGVAAEPDRERGGAARLLARRHDLLPFAASRPHRRRGGRAAAADPRGGADRAGRLRRGRRQARLDGRAEGRADPAARLSAGAALRDATRRRLPALGETPDRRAAEKPIPTPSSISPSPPARPASPRA